MSQKLDRFGAVASSLCALHCALCALLPAALSALGLGFLIGHEAEWLLTLVAVALGMVAMIVGWRQHRSFRVAGVLAIGIVGLLVSRGLEMGSDHHDSHDEVHHAQVEEASSQSNEGDDHEEEKQVEGEEHHVSTEEGDSGHLVGASVGVLAGLLLFLGHILNIRMVRKCLNSCCP
ncbi:MAG: MerC domain-containing protein [Deltaproteobacteria bacterium]|nr:MerC domain-containing protein [Deltaproteobacteria bacterium]MBT6490278.1 MerC domain-containing protein [Deltaproteobacteria bacterium]